MTWLTGRYHGFEKDFKRNSTRLMSVPNSTSNSVNNSDSDSDLHDWRAAVKEKALSALMLTILLADDVYSKDDIDVE